MGLLRSRRLQLDAGTEEHIPRPSKTRMRAPRGAPDAQRWGSGNAEGTEMLPDFPCGYPGTPASTPFSLTGTLNLATPAPGWRPPAASAPPTPPRGRRGGP